MSINKDLIAEAKKGDFKLTKRVSQTIRHRLAEQANAATRKIADHINGLSICKACEGEIKPFKMNRDDLTLLKTILPYAVTTLAPEDFASATDEPKTAEQIATVLADSITNKVMLRDVVKFSPKAAITCRDILIEMLPIDSKVKNIKEAV